MYTQKKRLKHENNLQKPHTSIATRAKQHRTGTMQTNAVPHSTTTNTARSLLAALLALCAHLLYTPAFGSWPLLMETITCISREEMDVSVTIADLGGTSKCNRSILVFWGLDGDLINSLNTKTVIVLLRYKHRCIMHVNYSQCIDLYIENKTLYRYTL